MAASFLPALCNSEPDTIPTCSSGPLALRWPPKGQVTLAASGPGPPAAGGQAQARAPLPHDLQSSPRRWSRAGDRRPAPEPRPTRLGQRSILTGRTHPCLAGYRVPSRSGAARIRHGGTPGATSSPTGWSACCRCSPGPEALDWSGRARRSGGDVVFPGNLCRPSRRRAVVDSGRSRRIASLDGRRRVPDRSTSPGFTTSATLTPVKSRSLPRNASGSNVAPARRHSHMPDVTATIATGAVVIPSCQPRVPARPSADRS